MAKVKRSGKASAGARSKGGRSARAAPPAAKALAASTTAESMTVTASLTMTHVEVVAAGVAGDAMPVSFAADSLTVDGSLAAPVGTEAIELFDVVCSFDSVVLSNVDFGVAQSTARKHNKAHPGHDAQPIRQLQ